MTSFVKKEPLQLLINVTGQYVSEGDQYKTEKATFFEEVVSIREVEEGWCVLTFEHSGAIRCKISYEDAIHKVASRMYR